MKSKAQLAREIKLSNPNLGLSEIARLLSTTRQNVYCALNRQKQREYRRTFYRIPANRIRKNIVEKIRKGLL